MKFKAKRPDAKPPSGPLILSSAQFVAGFVPPSYLIDGLLQRRFVYSMTGPTGHGKTTVMLCIVYHIAQGLPLDGREVEKSRVLYFAGENPDDVRMRWIKLCEEKRVEPDDMDVFFLPGSPPIGNAEIRAMIDRETKEHGPFGLLVIDTSAAYFQGDEENNNSQLHEHAKMMRSFVNLPGGPTVVVTCHPTKNPDLTNLLPRGGGAFLAEMDGNLVCIKNDPIVRVHWHGKFRGPDFAPLLFKLLPGTSDKLVDAKKRKISTVTATPISETEEGDIERAQWLRQAEMLVLLLDEGNARLSHSEMATKLGWLHKDGVTPNKQVAHRTMAALVARKLVEREGGRHVLTDKGRKAAAQSGLWGTRP